MEIHRCFEILELRKNASIQDVRQAYKDLVNIWHPDRVGDNSRLKKKAEEKLKDINIAYEETELFFVFPKRILSPRCKKSLVNSLSLKCFIPPKTLDSKQIKTQNHTWKFGQNPIYFRACGLSFPKLWMP